VQQARRITGRVGKPYSKSIALYYDDGSCVQVRAAQKKLGRTAELDPGDRHHP
jgi:hypothetical protein